MVLSTPDDVFANFGLSGEKIKQFVRSLLVDARSIFQDKLLYSKPSVDLSKLTDDLEDHRCSFVARESNNLQPSTRITDIASNYRQNSEAPRTLPNKSTYRRNIEKFLEMMLLLFLFTGGQPDQGPEIFARDTTREVPAELIALKHCAQLDSEDPFQARALYIDEGQVFIITADNQNEPTIRGRYLPDEVSQMLVLYLACVLPFQRTLDPSDCYSTSEFLFAHNVGLWHTGRYLRVLKRETKARMGVEMDLVTVNDYIRKMNVVFSESRAQ